MKKNRSGFLLLLLMFVLLFTSCGKHVQRHNKTVFRYNESKGIASLDPAYANNQTKIWPVNQLFNGLVQLDEQLIVKPCIASFWEISDDGLRYLFHLRNDVYFHDHPLFPDSTGRKVIADDFVFSLKRIASSATASPGSWVLNTVARDSLNGELAIVAVDPETLEITLKKPFQSFLSMLSMPYCSVVPHEILAHFGKEFRANPVGTGPFVFKIWKEGEKLVLVKNDRYFEQDGFGNKLPFLDAVAITFIKDKQSEFLEFVKGNLDFITGVHASYKDEILTRDGTLSKKYVGKISMSLHPYLNTEYLAFMVDSAKLDSGQQVVLDKNVRKAINYGFDRKKMMAYMRNNIGIAASSGFVPKGLPSFLDSLPKGFYYDPDLAASYLRKAGYPDGAGMPVIKLTTNSDYLDLCEYIQHELANIGIPIEIEVGTGATFREMVSNSKLAFFRGSWIADYADAQNYLSLFYSKNHSPNGPNYTHFSNVKYDELYERAIQTQDDSLRWNYYRKLDEMIIDEAIVVPLYYDMVVRFSQNSIRQLGSNAMNLLSLKKVQKSNDTHSR